MESDDFQLPIGQLRDMYEELLKEQEQKMAANDEQVGGKHYKTMGIEPWDYILANKLGFLEGQIIKYVSRWERKGGAEDLAKAKHCLEKLIEHCDATS